MKASQKGNPKNKSNDASNNTSNNASNNTSNNTLKSSGVDMSSYINEFFCERCDNILDISRTPMGNFGNAHGPHELEPETPSTISSDTDSSAKTDRSMAQPKVEKDVDYDTMLKRVEKGEKLTYDELNKIDVKDLAKNEYYKKMSKKGEIKKQILEMIDDMGNSDENTQAFMVCRNCSFSKEIKPQMKIMSKNPEGVVATHDYIDEVSYRNRIHFRTMPRTRKYECPNKNCPVYTKKKPNEAIFFRKNADTYETIYVCVNCMTVKSN